VVKRTDTAEPAPWPPQAQAWALVAILSVAYVFSYLDRIVINLLVGPIQAEFQIGDTAFGALQGVAFGLFYTLLALPIGRLVDTGPRRRVVYAGVSVFGAMTMLSGMAGHYWTLFLTRIGVGAGEASLSPAAYSMISDSFPPERLGRAIAVFTLSAFVGIGLAYLIGGVVIAWLQGLGSFRLGPFGVFEPWRVTFLLVGAPAVLLAPLIFVCQDPVRRGGGDAAPAIGDVMRAISDRRAAFVWLFAGFAVITFSSYASTVWSPAFLIRVYGLTPGEVGLALGAIYLVLGPLGAMLGGWACDRMTARGVLDAPLRVTAYGYIGAGVFGGAAPLAPTPELALAGLAGAAVFSTLPYPLAATAIQLVTPNRMRGQISAVYMTVINLVGLGIGPMAAGMLTDYVFSEPSDVRYSLALINAAAAPLVVLALSRGFRPYRALRQGEGAL